MTFLAFYVPFDQLPQKYKLVPILLNFFGTIHIHFLIDYTVDTILMRFIKVYLFNWKARCSYLNHTFINGIWHMPRISRKDNNIYRRYQFIYMCLPALQSATVEMKWTLYIPTANVRISLKHCVWDILKLLVIWRVSVELQCTIFGTACRPTDKNRAFNWACAL